MVWFGLVWGGFVLLAFSLFCFVFLVVFFFWGGGGFWKGRNSLGDLLFVFGCFCFWLGFLLFFVVVFFLFCD